MQILKYIVIMVAYQQKKETFTHTEHQEPQLLAGMKWK